MPYGRRFYRPPARPLALRHVVEYILPHFYAACQLYGRNVLVVLPWLVWILATLFQMVRSSDPAQENAEGDTEPLPGHLTNTFRYLVFNAGLEGIEPPLTGLEAVVLPLTRGTA